MKYRQATRNEFGNLITQPILWLPLPFVILLDIIIELYHRVCFPVYGLPLVKRSDYIQVLDRDRLEYLKVWEKLGCMYCGYVNGVLAYMVEIAGRTEGYWCGIMHQNKPGFIHHPHQLAQKFVPYGDKQALEDKYGK